MKIKVKFGLIAPLFLASILFSEQKIHLLLAVLAAALHECGHIFAAKLKKINLSSLSLDILGARLNTETGLCSYSDEIILCIFGPLMNFIVSAVSFSVFFLFFENEYIMFFGVSSMALGILNLLPIKSFDGGRILFCIISKFFN